MPRNGTSDDPLLQNCRPDWPEWTCVGANVCGLCSTTLWFFVLLPQVWKNFRRKSVIGLSVLWGTANFTASLINLCFVYGYATIPLYGKINSIYMPVLEFTILLQFWIYGDYNKKHKIAYLITCVCVWTTLISLNLGLKLYPYIQWIAITLWCIETFPQVQINLYHTCNLYDFFYVLFLYYFTLLCQYAFFFQFVDILFSIIEKTWWVFFFPQ
jgi:hypothetical protein